MTFSLKLKGTAGLGGDFMWLANLGAVLVIATAVPKSVNYLN